MSDFSTALDVRTRNIVLEENSVTLELCIRIPAQSEEDAFVQLGTVVPKLKFGVYLSYNPRLTVDLINKKVPLSNNTDIKNLSYQIISGDDFSLNEDCCFLKTSDPDGTTYYNLNHFVTFNNELEIGAEKNPNHLTSIVAVYDSDISQNLMGDENYRLTNKISSDVIFNQGRLVLTNHIVYDEEGTAYSGLTHKMASGTLMSGGDHSTKSQTLSYNKAPNFKIQDDRVLKEVSDTDLFSEEQSTGQEEGYPTIGNLCLSSDQHGNVRMLFAIDCLAAYREHSFYGDVVRDANLLNMIMENNRFTSLKFYRVDLEQDETTLLVKTADSSEKGFVRKNNVDQQGELIASIDETFISEDLTSNQRRYFVVTDNISSFSSGKFQWKVEVEVEDYTSIYYRTAIQNLNNAAQQMTEAKDLIETMDMIDCNSNRYKQKFIAENIGTFENQLVKYVSIYINALELMEDLSSTKQKILIRTIVNKVHPLSGNFDGLLTFIKMIKDLTLKMQSIETKTNILSGDTKKEKTDNTMDHLGDYNGLYTFAKAFNETYVVDCSNKTGIGTLNNKDEKNEKVGLAVVPFAEFEQKINARLKNYPGSMTPAKLVGKEKTFSFQPERNMFLFTSPSFIQIGDNVLKFPIANADLTKVAGLDMLFSFRNLQKGVNDTDDINVAIDDRHYYNATDNEEGIATTANEYFNSTSTTIVSNEIIEDAVKRGSFFIDINKDTATEKHLGSGGKFDNTESDKLKNSEEFVDAKLTNEKSNVDALETSGTIIAETKANEGKDDNNSLDSNSNFSMIDRTNEKLNLKNTKNFVDTMSSEQLIDLPNQIVSFVTDPPASFATGEVKRTQQNNSEFNVLYNTLQKLEILTTATSVTDEVWVDLTNERYKNLKEGGGTAVIRMVPYENATIGVENSFKCPVFDKCIILGTPKKGNVVMASQPRTVITNDTVKTYISPELANDTPALQGSRHDSCYGFVKTSGQAAPAKPTQGGTGGTTTQGTASQTKSTQTAASMRASYG